MKKIALLIAIVCTALHSNAQTWSVVGKGIQSQKIEAHNNIHAMVTYKEELYAAGTFTIAGGVIANYIAKWDGDKWSPVGEGMNGMIFTICVYKDELYAGGWFTTAGYEFANYIAKWDGVSWKSLGAGVNFHPNTLTVYKDELIVGGEFTKAGGMPANNIAKWNGTEWSTLGKGRDEITQFFEYKGNLYTGGYAFKGKYGFNVWNGSEWNKGGYDLTGLPNSMIVFNDELYAGGYFPYAPKDQMCITRFNGKKWSAVGTKGTDGHVYAMLVLDGALYAAGFFNTVEDMPAKNFAKWDGKSWTTFTPGIAFHAHALVVYKGEVYAAGGYERSESGTIGKEMIMKMPLNDFKAVNK